MGSSLLYRSRDDALIGGVCGGLSSYMGINPVYVRLFFVLMAFGNGVGFIIYLLLWLIIPLDGQVRPTSMAENIQAGSEEIAARTRSAGNDISQLLLGSQSRLGLFVGFALIAIGLLYLLPYFDLAWPSWLNFDLIWPILLIIGGLALLLRWPKGVKKDGRPTQTRE